MSMVPATGRAREIAQDWSHRPWARDAAMAVVILAGLLAPLFLGTQFKNW